MKIIKASKGTGSDLQNAIEDKIAQLNNETVLSYIEISDGDKSLLVDELETILEPECDDYAIHFSYGGVTVDIFVDDISKSWFFTYDELDLSKGIEQAIDYIANTIFSYLDDPAVEE